jgi:aminoacylase
MLIFSSIFDHHQPTMLTDAEAQAAIGRLCRFLQFPTVSSLAVETGAYRECAAWLTQQLEDARVFDQVFVLPEAPQHSPVVVALWKGRDESLPILLLNSHYDVVPADDKDWTVPPFEGLRLDGRVYGRGAQDMKCVCMQYIEAIIKIRQTHPTWIPERSIYLTFVPDEGTIHKSSILQWSNVP